MHNENRCLSVDYLIENVDSRTSLTHPIYFRSFTLHPNVIRIMREKCSFILLLLNCATLAEVAEPKGMIVSVAK